MALRRVVLAATLPLVLASGGCKKIGETRTLDVVADAPGEPGHPAAVKIAFGQGELRVTPGGGHTVGGSASSNARSLDPVVEAAGDRVTVSQGTSGSADDKLGPELVANWRLTLGPTPMALTLETAGSLAEVELGGVALKSVKVRARAGSLSLGWNAPNPLAADALEIEAGAGAVSLGNVGLFGGSSVRVHSAAGAILVALGSKVERDLSMDLEATAGAIDLKVPPTVPVRVEANKGAGVIKADASWRKEPNDVYTAGPAGAPRVIVKARAGVGAISLNVTP